MVEIHSGESGFRLQETLFQIATLFASAYLHASTTLNAIHGFQKCGFWPIDRKVFGPADFLSSTTVHIELAVPVTSGERIASLTTTKGGTSAELAVESTL